MHQRTPAGSSSDAGRILLSECERLKQHSLANKLISLFRQFGGTELRLKLVWLCWLDLMTGNSLDDWTKT